MVKKKVLVLGLAVAMLVGNGSVFASTEMNDASVSTGSTEVATSAVGVPTKILCDPILIVPFGEKLTVEMFLNYFTIVDSDLKDLGMKDQLSFSNNKGAKITVEEKVAEFNAGLVRGEPTVGLKDYLGISTIYGVTFAKESAVSTPAGITGNPAFEIPANTDITGDILRDHFQIVDINGKDLGMKDKIRFMTGKGGSITPEEEATILINTFKQDVKKVVPVIALVDGYPSFYCEANILLGQVVDNSYSVSYTTHVQNEGWHGEVQDGKMSGTEARSLRLEGIKIESGIDGVGVEYATHVENEGWHGYVANGKVSGTEGKSYRLEAIKIRLTGANASKYDVYYSVHAQNVGWMGWASNDAESGTAGFGYRLEGIKIKIVEKGSPAPGSVVNPFLQNK